MLERTDIESFDWLKLETRKKRQIPNVFGRLQRPREAMDEAFRIWREQFPNLRRRSANSTYNCHGMTFGGRRTDVGPEGTVMIRDDDGYKVVSRRDAMEGDIVVYRKNGRITHSGVIVRKQLVLNEREDELLILSQWGYDGEYLHAATTVPSVYGELSEIWSERNTI